MDDKYLFDSVKDKLYFKIRIAENHGQKEELQKLNTKEGRKYLWAYIEEDDFLEHRYDVKSLSFEEYTEIILNDFDVEGVAVYIRDEYIYYDYPYLLQQQMKQEWEKYLIGLVAEESIVSDEKEKQIEEYNQSRYIEYMGIVEKAWDMGAYRRAYGVLFLLAEMCPEKAGEFLYYCALVSEKAGNLNHAELMYREAVKWERNNYWLYYQLAQFYRRMGRDNQEKEVYETAYKHHRFYSTNSEEPQNDGIQYVLEALIQHEQLKKKPLQKIVYRKYKEKIAYEYELLPEFKTYCYLED